MDNCLSKEYKLLCSCVFINKPAYHVHLYLIMECQQFPAENLGGHSVLCNTMGCGTVGVYGSPGSVQISVTKVYGPRLLVLRGVGDVQFRTKLGAW